MRDSAEISREIKTSFLMGEAMSNNVFCCYTESLQMGAAIDMFIVNAPASAIPKAIVAKLNAFLLGQSINVAEVASNFFSLHILFRTLLPKLFLQNFFLSPAIPPATFAIPKMLRKSFSHLCCDLPLLFFSVISYYHHICFKHNCNFCMKNISC